MITVVGIGNRLRGDDAVGPMVIDHLRAENNRDNLELHELDSDAFALLDFLLNSERLILVDCAEMGESPGQIRVFSMDEVTLKTVDRFFSLHGISVAEIYRLAGNLGKVAACTIIAVQPQTLRFGSDLSAAVKGALPSLIRIIKREACINEKDTCY